MTDLHEEAESCRRQAIAYLGRPEASFLLNAAREFERVAEFGRLQASSSKRDPVQRT